MPRERKSFSVLFQVVNLLHHNLEKILLNNSDRLINDDDRQWFNTAVLQQLHEALGLENWTMHDFADCLYADFLTRANKEYQELKVV